MRCRQCEFENIPGLTRCFKCGSVLEANEPMDVNPVRMSGWKKPLRDISRKWRATGIYVPIERPAWFKNAASDSFLSISFSVIPGLGHYLYGTLKSILWLLPVWVFLIAAAILMYGSAVGLFCFGLAAGLHAFIAMSCYFFEQEKGFIRQIFLMIILSVAFAVLYYIIGGLVFRDFSAQYANMNFDGRKVRSGDFILCRTSLLKSQGLKPGDLVVARAVYVQNHGVYRLADPLAIGQIIGKSGDVVKIEDGTYTLNGKALDKIKFPVPEWLKNRELTAEIPDGHYFFSTAYAVTAHNAEPANYFTNVCVISGERIEAKVFMRWLPLSRRGFIGDMQ